MLVVSVHVLIGQVVTVIVRWCFQSDCWPWVLGILEYEILIVDGGWVRRSLSLLLVRWWLSQIDLACVGPGYVGLGSSCCNHLVLIQCFYEFRSCIMVGIVPMEHHLQSLGRFLLEWCRLFHKASSRLAWSIQCCYAKKHWMSHEFVSKGTSKLSLKFCCEGDWSLGRR